MRTGIFLFMLITGSIGVAQAQMYSADLIPAELKENADVVMREDIIRWTIFAPERATNHVRSVMTILNSKGDGGAEIEIGYDKLSKVSDLKIIVYDANGGLIRKVKNSEIRDASAFDGFSLFSDNRVKHVDVAQSNYPYTVELEYEVEYKFLFVNMNSFMLSPRTSCENFKFEITYRPDLAPRYRVLNSEVATVQRDNSDGTKTLAWEAHNLKAIKREPAGPSFAEIAPGIISAPSAFSFSGYSGKMNTWEDLGKWHQQLNAGRDVIPDATRKKVAELTANLKTTAEKSKVLYEYLQGKTRYVSIQLGIGGLQPFEASVVDDVGYGDCKALSNYMVALLKEAGVKGYYTKVKAGEDAASIRADFPSQQFNHVIVSVPNGNDTLWLECTSQTNPFGYQGTFTGNRKALMITEAGGRLVSTKRYVDSRNVRQRVASVDLQANGDAKARVTTSYKGLRYESNNLDHYINQSKDDQKEWVLSTTRIPNFNLDQFTMVNHKSMDPSADVELGLSLSRYASVSGKRIFVVPNLMNRSTYIPEAVPERKSKVIVDMGLVDIDSVVYSIPESIYPEFVPKPIKHESQFGTYEATFALDAGKLVYTRRLTTKQGEFPPESYKEYAEFYRNINKADNLKIVFLSKT